MALVENIADQSEAVLEPITHENIGPVWPHLEPHLQGVFDRSGGRMDAQTLAANVLSNKLHLLAVVMNEAVVGVVGVQLGMADTGMKIATVRFCSGENSGKWLHLLDQIEQWARANGAQKIETWARKGWARRLESYKLTHVLLEKDL